ncbi:MAG: hypothetical protein HFJ29_01550 [Clostridia bacterium]|nr:hypothetical protein [Clostridia bacterium]
MYQLAEKNKVMSLFHKGQSVSQIRLKSNVSKSTLYRWKAEYDTTGKIIEYIRKGNLEAAKREISQFQEGHKKSSVLLTGKVINQFIHFDYLDDAEELAKELLKQNPNELSVRSQLVKIAKRKGDWEEVERLSREILALEPSNLLSRNQLITIAMRKEDEEEVERLRKEILALDPNNLSLRSQLAKKAKKKGDWEEAERLSREVLALEPNDMPARIQLTEIARRKGDWEEVERLCKERLAIEPNDMPARRQIELCEKMKKGQQRRSDRGSRRTNQKDEETPKKGHSIQHNVQVIRRQIREGTFSLDDIEQRNKEMQEMGIEETQRNLLIAEAYEKQNFPRQTKVYLKRALQSTQDPKQQKAIKALIETAQAKKKPGQQIDPWNISTAIISSKSNVQVSKVPDEK